MRPFLSFTLLFSVFVVACDTADVPDPSGQTEAPTPASTTTWADSLAVVATVDAFHAALAAADTAGVDRLLADDALVLESGGIEDRAEYFGHHLGADMSFAAAVPGDREVVRVDISGHVAWLAAASRRHGTFRDREIDTRGAELVVLRRAPDGWRIWSIHWSSRSGD